MAYYDFTGFTHVDPNNRWTLTTTRATGVSAQNGDGATYSYYDLGVDFIPNIFSYDMEIYVSGSGINSRFYLWSVGNNYDSNSHSLFLRVQSPGTTGYYSFYLLNNNGSTEVYDFTNLTLYSTLYYIKVYRTGTNATCKIYTSASDRINNINVVDTLSITCESIAYRYIKTAMSGGLTGYVSASGYVENLTIPELTQSISDTLGFDDSWTLTPSQENQFIYDDLGLDDSWETDLNLQGIYNFTSFTEVDPLGHWTKTETRTTGTGITRVEHSYNYKDLGVDTIPNDYTFDFDFCKTGFYAPSGSDTIGLWSVSNNYGSISELTSGQNIQLQNVFPDSFKIYLFDRGIGTYDYYTFTSGLTDVYYVKVYRIDTATTAKIYASANDRLLNINVIDTLAITCEADEYRYIQAGLSSYTSGTETVSAYIENLTVQAAKQEIDEILGMNDEWEIDPSQQNVYINETLELSDVIQTAHNFWETAGIDELGLHDSIITTETPWFNYNINIKVNWVQKFYYDITTKINTCIGVIKDMVLKVNTVIAEIFDINIDVRTKKLELYDIAIDVRFILPWMKAGELGFQSRGKEYIKVYINTVETTDVDIDSISISRNINSPSICSFDLVRAYDATAPTKKQKVEVKYGDYLLYTGYITNVEPTSNPENIKISCKDKYWYVNQYEDKVFFFVGHKPPEEEGATVEWGNPPVEKDVYYDTISGGLGAVGYTATSVGGFTPETISCFGIPNSDAITSLITQAGNYGWFYDVNENQRLWTAGEGNIIELDTQKLGKNLGLYQVLDHDIQTSVDGLVNEYRVQMGDKVVKKWAKSSLNSSSSSGETLTKEYTSIKRIFYKGYALPAWSCLNEVFASPVEGQPAFGWNRPRLDEEYKYNDVYTRYDLPELNEDEEWTDEHPPSVSIYWSVGKHIVGLPVESGSVDIMSPGSANLNSGFTIDYAHSQLLFNNRIYQQEIPEDRAPGFPTSVQVILYMWKKRYYTETRNYGFFGDPPGLPDPIDPTEDVTNPLMFFTGKMGNYSDTIQGALNLTNCSIQIGGSYYESNRKKVTVPSWDDTHFAADNANWELSQKCDIEEYGTISLTIDALMFYGIDLNKRIYAEGITSQNLNIESINISIRDFTVQLNVKNGRTYARTVSIPYHGT